MSNVKIIGHLTEDPDPRYMGNGSYWCCLCVAEVDACGIYKDRKQTEGANILTVIVTKESQNWIHHCCKGEKVYVVGQQTTRNWLDTGGVERCSPEILVKHRNDYVELMIKCTSSLPVDLCPEHQVPYLGE